MVNDISYIEKQLKYIKETIRPFFSLRTNNNGPTNEVSKEKLINLWFEKRKKAISRGGLAGGATGLGPEGPPSGRPIMGPFSCGKFFQSYII